jgi:hypothetical protein
MSNNNFKILLKDKKGVELKDWLTTDGHRLKNQRIFYILKANIDKGDVFKIGLSERGNNAAFSRLQDYYHFYDKSTSSNPCKGVKLYLVLANTFNADVDNPNARVRRVETKMKAFLKPKIARGSERFHISIDELFKYMEDNNLLEEEEIEKETRQTPRLKEKGQGSQDAVASIIGHKKERNGIVKFDVEFMEAFKYDRNDKGKKVQMPNKRLTYDELIGYRHGKRKADMYIKKHGL